MTMGIFLGIFLLGTGVVLLAFEGRVPGGGGRLILAAGALVLVVT